MNPKSKLRHLLLCVSTMLAGSSAHAATMSASPAAPVIDGEDIANYGVVTNSDKWWVGTDGTTSARGQSFTTGGAAVRVKSITYQLLGTMPTKTYAIRVGKLAGSNFTLVHSETATQSFAWNAGDFMTWTFDSPVILDPYTTYGIDVGMLTSTSDWPTGIPYINVTDDVYAGGMRYSSGASGVGTATVSYTDQFRPRFPPRHRAPARTGLRTRRPKPGRQLHRRAGQPRDGAHLQPERHTRLRQSHHPESNGWHRCHAGPANDSRLTYDQNEVRINPAGLLDWSKNYAIRLDAGVFLGDGGAPIAAITDDTTWNFTTAAGDPLLDAIAALKAHILNTAPLTGPQIAAHKATIDATRSRFDENAAPSARSSTW
jgi:hypothetical protein